jgi:hypothetical protein
VTLARPHVGKRGRVLLFFGCVDVVIALSLAVPDAATRGNALYVWLADIAPLWVWSLAWAGVAAVLFWQAFCLRDWIGYAAAIGLKIGWGLLCLGGWAFAGVDRGYVSAGIWLVVAAIVGEIAGWPEPPNRKGPPWTGQPSSR